MKEELIGNIPSMIAKLLKSKTVLGPPRWCVDDFFDMLKWHHYMRRWTHTYSKSKVYDTLLQMILKLCIVSSEILCSIDVGGMRIFDIFESIVCFCSWRTRIQYSFVPWFWMLWTMLVCLVLTCNAQSQRHNQNYSRIWILYCKS